LEGPDLDLAGWYFNSPVLGSYTGVFNMGVLSGIG